MSDNQSDDRMRRLDERLAKLKAAQKSTQSASSGKTEAYSASNTDRGLAQGMRMGVDLVAAVTVGAVLGWGMDYLLNTRPWLMIVMIFLGFAAGIRNVIRIGGGFSVPNANMTQEEKEDDHGIRKPD